MKITNVTLKLIAKEIVESCNNNFEDLDSEIHEALTSSTYIEFDLNNPEDCITLFNDIESKLTEIIYEIIK